MGQLYNYSNYHNTYFNKTKIKIINCQRENKRMDTEGWTLAVIL